MSRSGHVFCRSCLAALMLCALSGMQTVHAASMARNPLRVSFRCSDFGCGMPARGAFPHLVVGRIVAIANARQAQALFAAMRKTGHWSGLPDSGGSFWKYLQPVAIDAGHGTVMTVLMGQDEMHAAPLGVGDTVRYSTHFGRYETPPSDPVAAAYWVVDGCVAILCRAGYAQCDRQYVYGIFRRRDGVQLSPRDFTPLRGGVTIDNQTMWPKSRAH